MFSNDVEQLHSNNKCLKCARVRLTLAPHTLNQAIERASTLCACMQLILRRR